jgi:hypothetical protein
MRGILQSLAAASICWFLGSSLWFYPHSLSYFNESIGGPLNASKHLLGSNVDWGQDLGYAIDSSAKCHTSATIFTSLSGASSLARRSCSQPVIDEKSANDFL